MKKESYREGLFIEFRSDLRRLSLQISGAVQGVGFRPFIFRLAGALNLAGWISNSTAGVEIELEGTAPALAEFMTRLESERPPNSILQSIKSSEIDPRGETGFRILESNGEGEKSAIVLPDIATCPDCLAEIFDPNNRRYLYPFTNCTNCGPRYSIIQALPYDRLNTSMNKFQMCDECRREYEDPLNRRFHAQPNACPQCGPHIELWDNRGRSLCINQEALDQAVRAILEGRILALKGLGGFQLLVDAQNNAAVERLRIKKGREQKPFALIYADLEMILRDCEVAELEKNLLSSSEAPIVLLKRRNFNLSDFPRSLEAVAPHNPYLGIMLPYTPLHHLLMKQLRRPVVATSGNLSEEPICINESEAVMRLGKIADLLLVNDRPIVRHIDDSVVQVVSGREMILRRARGYAPLPVRGLQSTGRYLAVGAHQKNTVAISSRDNIFVSQHIGDLDNQLARDAFEATISSLSRLYEHDSDKIICDKHPDYSGSVFAEKSGKPIVKIQHHYAHVLSCMAENEIEFPVLGVAWDGTGYGDDGTIWGGEFLLINEDSYKRAGHLRTFPLPGGERAIYEPRRSALGLLYEIYRSNIFCVAEPNPLSHFESMQGGNMLHMLKNEINCPLTSSAGRLFDAVASLLDLKQIMDFEGQAAMLLEFAATQGESDALYEFAIDNKADKLVINWEPTILSILHECRVNIKPPVIAAKFHNTLAEIIVETARRIGREQVALSGGCFQNRYLSECAHRKLLQAGFKVCRHRYLPPNDGGICVGQIMAATRMRKREQ